MALRTLGVEGLSGINRNKVDRLKMVNESELPAMKGNDHGASFPEDVSSKCKNMEVRLAQTDK